MRFFFEFLGITRNPIGEQSKTIYQDIVKLINHYIEPITAVVLHVIPASVDFTTSESIQISKTYDPNCKNALSEKNKNRSLNFCFLSRR
jgi:hypothetical protein